MSALQNSRPCPIEAGLLGALADHECPCGFIPTSRQKVPPAWCTHWDRALGIERCAAPWCSTPVDVAGVVCGDECAAMLAGREAVAA